MTTAELAQRVNDAEERLARLITESGDHDLINALLESRIALIKWFEQVRPVRPL